MSPPFACRGAAGDGIQRLIDILQVLEDRYFHTRRQQCDGDRDRIPALRVKALPDFLDQFSHFIVQVVKCAHVDICLCAQRLARVIVDARALVRAGVDAGHLMNHQGVAVDAEDGALSANFLERGAPRGDVAVGFHVSFA